MNGIQLDGTEIDGYRDRASVSHPLTHAFHRGLLEPNFTESNFTLPALPTHQVQLRVTLDGAVPDFTPEVQSAIKSKIASELDVDESAVSLVVVPASVLLIITIDYTTEGAADAAQATLATKLATEAEASSVLSTPQLAVNAVSAPVITAGEILSPSAPPPALPPSSPPGYPPSVPPVDYSPLESEVREQGEAREEILPSRAPPNGGRCRRGVFLAFSCAGANCIGAGRDHWIDDCVAPRHCRRRRGRPHWHQQAA